MCHLVKHESLSVEVRECSPDLPAILPLSARCIHTECVHDSVQSTFIRSVSISLWAPHYLLKLISGSEALGLSREGLVLPQLWV